MSRRAVLDQQPDDRVFSGGDGLMQRRRMTVDRLRIVPIGIFTCFEQYPDDLNLAELRSERHRTMPILGRRSRQQPADGVRASQASRRGDGVHPRASQRQRPSGVEVTKRERGHQGQPGSLDLRCGVLTWIARSHAPSPI
jgi:hypothetical protein